MSCKNASNEIKTMDAKQHRFEMFITSNNLNLSQQNLSDKDMPDLIQFLQNFPAVETLDLSLNNIGDEGIVYFAERNINVKQVNLNGNNISDHGVALFAYKNQVVEYINFSHNFISDKGINQFSEINQTCLHSQFTTIQLH